MKRISGVRKTTHKLLLKATRDYFNGQFNPNIIKHIVGEKVMLTEEEKSDAWAIKTNIEDLVYRNSL